MKILEGWFGLALFRRLPSRGVALTPAGQRFAAAAGEVLDGLAEASARLRRQGQDHVLTVSTTHSFASLWLIRASAASARSIPTSTCGWSPTTAWWTLPATTRTWRSGTGAAAIRPALRPPDARRRLPGLQPGPARRRAAAALTRDLARHTLLHDDDPIDVEAVGWPQWLAAVGVTGVDASRGPRFTHTFMILQVATAGGGVGLATKVLGGDLVTGTGLVRPFPDEVASPYSFFLVTPTEDDAPKVARFREWITAQVAASDR